MKLGTILIHVPDVKKAVAFYEAAFGQKQQFIDPSAEYAELACEGGRLGFIAYKLAESNLGKHSIWDATQDPGPVEVSFLTEEIENAYQRALDAGATPVAAPAEKPWGQTIAYVRDLNGMLVQLETPMNIPS